MCMSHQLVQVDRHARQQSIKQSIRETLRQAAGVMKGVF